MHFDLSTLYFLAVGTLLLSACMTLWERQARSERASELDILAGGYTALAFGCALATARSQISGGLGAALSNIVMLGGYLLILNGVAQLSGRQYRGASFALLVSAALAWAIAGGRWEASLWSYISALPIAIASGVTSWEAWRSGALRSFRSRQIIVALTAIHALLYAGRVFILPMLVARFGPELASVASKVTMYEGVLYSVGLPAALLALIREEAHGQLLDASRTDHLTGLANRRWFFEEGERVIRDAPAHRSLSLLAFDLDHFKSINDRFGHATGDEVLRLFARAAGSKACASALLARTGGEEFVALLPDHGSLHAMRVGEAIATSFSQAVALSSQCVGVRATVSIGVARFGDDGDSLGDLLAAADRALYVAKDLGRNRVEFASSASFARAC
jgi:diguanylate cyclase (GGDEF)-like protein